MEVAMTKVIITRDTTVLVGIQNLSATSDVQNMLE